MSRENFDESLEEVLGGVEIYDPNGQLKHPEEDDGLLDSEDTRIAETTTADGSEYSRKAVQG